MNIDVVDEDEIMKSPVVEAVAEVVISHEDEEMTFMPPPGLIQHVYRDIAPMIDVEAEDYPVKDDSSDAGDMEDNINMADEESSLICTLTTSLSMLSISDNLDDAKLDSGSDDAGFIVPPLPPALFVNMRPTRRRGPATEELLFGLNDDSANDWQNRRASRRTTKLSAAQVEEAPTSVLRSSRTRAQPYDLSSRHRRASRFRDNTETAEDVRPVMPSDESVVDLATLLGFTDPELDTITTPMPGTRLAYDHQDVISDVAKLAPVDDDDETCLSEEEVEALFGADTGPVSDETADAFILEALSQFIAPPQISIDT